MSDLFNSLNELVTQFYDVDHEELTPMLKEFSYEGFDPAHTFSILCKHASKAEKDKKAMIQDMTLLTALCCIRGTKISKMTDRMSEKGKNHIKKLKGAYNIVEKKKPGKDDIIMARIAGCFPQITAELLKKDIIKSDVVADDIEDLPKYLKFSQAPSIIPSTDTELYEKWLKWAIKFDSVINEGKGDEEKVKKYSSIVYNSRLLNDEERASVLDSLK